MTTVLFGVQHLLGRGHLQRAATLARAMRERGLRVVVASGGTPAPELVGGGVELLQLPPVRALSWKAYDHYLKANRVEEGIRSYDAVITLLSRARFEDNWVPVLRDGNSR